MYTPQNLTADPETCDSGARGSWYFNDTDDTFYGCDGTTWTDMLGGGFDTLTNDYGAGAVAVTTDLSATLCGTAEYLVDDGGSWSCDPVVTDTTYTAGDHLTLTASDFDLDTEVITNTFSFVLESPGTGDSGFLQHSTNIQGTITRIQCSTDTSTATINIEERVLATPNTAGDDAMSTELVCDTDSQTSTTMQNQPFDATDPLALTISAVGTPGVVRVHVTYTVDDV